jgi:hypothetical protein
MKPRHTQRVPVWAAAIAGGYLIVAPGAIRGAHAALVVNFNLTTDQATGSPVPASAASNIMSAVNAAAGMYNDWSNYTKTINVYYNSGVATADGNFNGTIRFGPSSQYHNSLVAFHELNHTLGAGTYGAWLSNVDLANTVWTGPAGIAMTQQYFPNNVLKADGHIHWVGGGSVPQMDMTREGVHIMGAIRADMGLSNGNLYDLPGDFSDNNTMDLTDYNILVENLHTNVSALSPVEAYRRGDMTFDGQINHADFSAFRAAYAARQGPGGIERGTAAPEPTAMVLLGLGALAACLRRKSRGVASGCRSAAEPR